MEHRSPHLASIILPPIALFIHAEPILSQFRVYFLLILVEIFQHVLRRKPLFRLGRLVFPLFMIFQFLLLLLLFLGVIFYVGGCGSLAGLETVSGLRLVRVVGRRSGRSVGGGG